MKRIFQSVVMTVAVLSFVSLSWAGIITGKLTKIDEKKSEYVVKDAKGKSHRVHFDATTQKTGDIKVGAQVEVDEEKGHAKSVKAEEKKVEEKKEKK